MADQGRDYPLASTPVPLKVQAKNASNEVDRKVSVAKSSGHYQWTPKEQAEYQKEKSNASTKRDDAQIQKELAKKRK